MCQQGGNPFGGPCAFGIIVDVAQGLERQRIGLAQCMMLAAHRQNGGARRQSLVEDIDLRTLITAELQGEQRQQDRFARAGRRSEEHTSELQSLMRISYAVFCLNKQNAHTKKRTSLITIHQSKSNKTRT